MRSKIFFLLFLFAMIHVPAVSAANPLTKLGRGLTNILFSPMEIPTNIQKVGDRKGMASGFFEGLFTGVYYTGGRILTGVYDVVTFPIPAPKDYNAWMKPDSVFEAASQA